MLAAGPGFSGSDVFLAGRPVRHISTKQPGMGAGPPRSAACRRYAVGDMPVTSAKRALKVPRLVKPTR